MTELEIVHAEPPIFDRVLALVGAEARDSTVFAWGRQLYVPDGQAVPEDTIVHEVVHSRRQGDDPAAWWERWLTDPAFRLDEEARGYGAQLAYLRRRFRKHELRIRLAVGIASVLAGPLYGNLVDHNTAARLLARYAK